MSNSKRNKSEMAPSFQKSRKLQDTKNEPLKPGEKAQPTAEQIRIAQIIDTKPDDPTLKDKIKQVMDATKKTEDEVLTALHDCDNDPNQAVTMILEGSQKEWSTLTKKKKNKPPADKLRDNQQPNVGNKSSNTTGASANEGGEDWNESDNADENTAPNKSIKGKGPGNRPNRASSRPWVKRGVTRSNGKENFNRGSENNSEWSKVGSFKPSRGRGNFKNSRNSSQKDCDNSDREISERLGQADVPPEKQDSGSDWGSDTSDHHKNISGNENSEDKQGDNLNKQPLNDGKWQSDNQYWSKNTGRGVGRGGSRGRGGYNSFAGKQFNDGDSKPSYASKGSSNVNSNRGRGRYNRPEGRGRGDGRPRPQRDSRSNHESSWDNESGDRGGYRGGRMSNGPSNRPWRGSRGRGRGSRPSIDTWNPHSSKENHEGGEDWDQEEVYTGSLADTKVFTPSSSVDVAKVPLDNPQKESHEGDVGGQLISQNEVSSNIPSSSQFLSQLTQASTGKPLPQSIFNDVHFTKTDLPASDFSGGFSINTFTESESPNIPMDDLSRVKTTRPRVPPPSKIPSSAVEMPPDVGSGIPLVDVQFGALELGDVMENVQQSSTQGSPSPAAETLQPQPSMMTAVSDPLLLNETQTYSAVRSSVQSNPISQLPELLSSKSEPPTSSFYQESIYQSNQFPKSTHQSYNANYTTQQVGSTYNTQSIYGSAGLGTTSLSNPYQTYSGSNIQRHSALTSTTNSKEFDVPTPSVNISPINPSSGTTVTPSSILSSAQGSVASKSSSSTMGKMMTVPPGVAASPIVNAPQYIMNQTPYFQQPLYSLEDFQLLQQQRLPPGHVPGYYDVTFQNTANREGVQFNLSDTRYAQGDSNTSPVQASSLNAQTGSQNHQQPMMNPALPPPYAYAFYSGSMIPGSYQYSTPAIFPIAPSGTGSGHGSTNSHYPKTPANYTGSYTGNYEGSQPASDYKSANTQGVSKVQQYQVTNASTSTGLSNIYTKSYEKSFCQTPPPYTLGSQSSGLGPSYGAQTQQMFYSPVTHHTMHQPLHQDSANAASGRSQLASQSNKVNNKPKYQTTYWHQQN